MVPERAPEPASPQSPSPEGPSQPANVLQLVREESPRAPLEERAQQFRAAARKAFQWFGAGVVTMGLALLLFPLVLTPATNFVATAVFAGGAVASAVAVAKALRALRVYSRISYGPRRPRGLAVLTTVVPLLAGALMTLVGALLTLLSTATFTRGRQLRKRTELLLPPVVTSDAWTEPGAGRSASAASRSAPLPAEPTEELFGVARGEKAATKTEGAALDAGPDRRGVADQWRENGRTEHASVAAFAQLTLELVALGAPPKLVKAAQEDALDELRHTELCFALARRFDGRALSPGPFPQLRQLTAPRGPRSLALARLAVQSLVDGALNEGVSAAIIAKLAPRAGSAAIREVLVEIAADEGRHAAHGWDVVEWCLAEGGSSVAAALEGAVLALPVEMVANRSEAALAGRWERYGLHSAALEVEELRRLRASVVRRVEALVRPPIGLGDGAATEPSLEGPGRADG